MSRSPKAAGRQSRRLERRQGKKGVVSAEIAFEEEPEPSRARIEPVKPITENQKIFDSLIRSKRIIFAMGPAGTGKTWFSAMRAAEALEAKLTKKIYICRPAVEAEESLGFLPGELEEKYEPYIRPLREAFEEKFGKSRFDYMLKKGIIEARPLAYLRGSTLKDCWVLLDEAQNLTPKQMKMFLTRIGVNAKFIITGDPAQKDIPGPCGLVDGNKRIKQIEGVATMIFTSEDVVRDDICMEIVKAYEKEPEEIF